MVLRNNGTRGIRFPYASPIAKIEFARLEEAVVKPYSGQHGYETNIWPIPTDRFAPASDSYLLDHTANEAVIRRTVGPEMADLYSRLFVLQQRFTWVAAILFLIFLTCITALSTLPGNWMQQLFINAAGGIVGSILLTVVSLTMIRRALISTRRRPRSKLGK